jgi:hypothetical protein
MLVLTTIVVNTHTTHNILYKYPKQYPLSTVKVSLKLDNNVKNVLWKSTMNEHFDFKVKRPIHQVQK